MRAGNLREFSQSGFSHRDQVGFFGTPGGSQFVNRGVWATDTDKVGVHYRSKLRCGLATQNASQREARWFRLDFGLEYRNLPGNLLGNLLVQLRF